MLLAKLPPQPSERVNTRRAAVVLLAGCLWAIASTATGQVLSGSYVGDGIAGRTVDVGFAPQVVIVQATNTQIAVMRTGTMPEGMSKAITAAALASAQITSFTSAGFVVGTSARVNATGITYHWVAFQASPALVTGTYVGNATARAIAGLGFAPIGVVVVPASSDRINHKTSGMSGSMSFRLETDAGATTRITNLGPDGFSLGTSLEVNRAGTTFHYVAFGPSGHTSTGFYVGNGVSPRAVGGVGFQPEYVMVKAAMNVPGAHRPASFGLSTLSLQFSNTVPGSEMVLSLDADGFSVGSSNRVNTNGPSYSFLAFRRIPPTVSDVSPPVGPAVGGTAITITGQHILPGATVTVGGVPALGVVVVDATTVTAVTPPGGSGAAEVGVQNPDGQTGTWAGGFTYVPAPTVTTVLPASGPAVGGTAVTLIGTGLLPGLTVTVGGVPALDVVVVDATTVTAVTPPGGSGAAEVGVQNPDGQTGTWAGGFTYVVLAFEAYLAEGATSSFFETRIALLNPNIEPAHAVVRFVTGDGSTVTQTYDLPGRTRMTLEPRMFPELVSAEFSTVVASDRFLAVDRTMTWDGGGYGQHAEVATPSPRTTWYVAEGATHGGFDLFYLIQNTTPSDADLEVTYLRPAPAPPVVRRYRVPAASRFNIWVDLEGPELADTAVSAILQSTNGVPVLVERSMYFTPPTGRMFEAGHNSTAVADPSTSWYFAEGATGRYFDMFLLLANTTSTPADVRARYVRADGLVVVKEYLVAPHSRLDVWVDHEDPALSDTALCVEVLSTNGVGIVAERAMWWRDSPSADWHGAHASSGSTRTGTVWAAAEGEVGGPGEVETYLLVANTGVADGQVRVTLVFEDGGTRAKVFMLAPTCRFSVNVAAEFPDARDRRFGILVEGLGATPPALVVERSMYSSAGGVRWAAGTNGLASLVP